MINFFREYNFNTKYKLKILNLIQANELNHYFQRAYSFNKYSSTYYVVDSLLVTGGYSYEQDEIPAFVELMF